MTAYESASLAIAKYQLWASVGADAVALAAAIAGLWTLFELVRQVRAAVEANSIGQLNALLALEQDMSRRRDRLGEISVKMHDFQKTEAYKADPKTFEPLAKQAAEAKENYLNALDRLSFCILRGKFSEEELRADYRDVVKAAITDFPDQFGAATPFRNIVKLHQRWADT